MISADPILFSVLYFEYIPRVTIYHNGSLRATREQRYANSLGQKGNELTATGFEFTKKRHTDTYDFINPATKSDHTDRYVFVTGASKGVGRSTAIAYAQAGAAGIAIGARSDFTSVEKEIYAAAEKAGKKAPKVLKLKLNVLDYESVQNAAKEIETSFGRLDILINNAGYLSPFEKIMDSDPGEYWMNYEVNVRGVYWITKCCLPLMLKGGEKTIVNISSIGAHGLREGGSGYQTTKMAVLRFTEYLMVEYGEQGLLTFAVHPTSSKTALAANMPASTHGSKLFSDLRLDKWLTFSSPYRYDRNSF